MLIHDRIQLIIKSNKLTASEFAVKIDVKRSNLSHVLSGRNKHSLDFLSKIISTYPNVNASWLITGETRDGKDLPTKPSSDHQKVTMHKRVDGEGEIDRILIFFNDGSFKSYTPK